MAGEIYGKEKRVTHTCELYCLFTQDMQWNVYLFLTLYTSLPPRTKIDSTFSLKSGSDINCTAAWTLGQTWSAPIGGVLEERPSGSSSILDDDEWKGTRKALRYNACSDWLPECLADYNLQCTGMLSCGFCICTNEMKPRPTAKYQGITFPYR